MRGLHHCAQEVFCQTDPTACGNLVRYGLTVKGRELFFANPA